MPEEREPCRLDAVRALLAVTPRTLDAWLRNLPAGWEGVREGEGTWSPREIVGHLIHGERVDWIPRARIILQEGESRPFDRVDRTGHASHIEGRELGDLLDEFTRLRGENLQTLDAMHLQPTDLDRRGRHPDLGVVTLKQLLATWVAHDCDHLMQTARVLASRYRDEVGPWRAYLRVISGQQG